MFVVNNKKKIENIKRVIIRSVKRRTETKTKVY